jgi:hypothetical protein
MFLKIL